MMESISVLSMLIKVGKLGKFSKDSIKPLSSELVEVELLLFSEL